MTPISQHIPWSAADIGDAGDITADEEHLVEQVIVEAVERGELAYDEDVLEGRVFPLVW